MLSTLFKDRVMQSCSQCFRAFRGESVEQHSTWDIKNMLETLFREQFPDLEAQNTSQHSPISKNVSDVFYTFLQSSNQENPILRHFVIKDFSPSTGSSNGNERIDKNDSSHRREYSNHRSSMKKQTLQNNNISAQQQLFYLERLDCQNTTQNQLSLLTHSQQQNQVLQSEPTENQGILHLPRIAKPQEIPSTPFLGDSNQELKDHQGDYQHNHKEIENEECMNAESNNIFNETTPLRQHQGHIQRESKQVTQSEYPVFQHSSTNTNHQIIHHNRYLKIKRSNERIENDKRKCKQIGKTTTQFTKPPQTVNLNHNIPFQQILQGEQINIQALASSSNPRYQSHKISSVESILQQTRQQEQEPNLQQKSRFQGQQENQLNQVFQQDSLEVNQLKQCSKEIITEQRILAANTEDPLLASQQGNILISSNSNVRNDPHKPKISSQIRRDSLCQLKQQQGQQGQSEQIVILPSRARRLLF